MNIKVSSHYALSWWRQQMETFSALLAFCEGNSSVPGEFSAQRPVTRSFDVFFDLHRNKQISKQSRRWWFETLSGSLWRHCVSNCVNQSLTRSDWVVALLVSLDHSILTNSGLILGLRPANERQRYFVNDVSHWLVASLESALSLMPHAVFPLGTHLKQYTYPDSKVHRTNMGPTWVLSAPDGPHVSPMNLAIWDHT